MDKEDDKAELRRKESRLWCFIIISPVITGSHTDTTRRLFHRLKLRYNEKLNSSYFPVLHHTQKISALGYCCFCLWALKLLLFLLGFSFPNPSSFLHIFIPAVSRSCLLGGSILSTCTIPNPEIISCGQAND